MHTPIPIVGVQRTCVSKQSATHSPSCHQLQALFSLRPRIWPSIQDCSSNQAPNYLTCCSYSQNSTTWVAIVLVWSQRQNVATSNTSHQFQHHLKCADPKKPWPSNKSFQTSLKHSSANKGSRAAMRRVWLKSLNKNCAFGK